MSKSMNSLVCLSSQDCQAGFHSQFEIFIKSSTGFFCLQKFVHRDALVDFGVSTRLFNEVFSADPKSWSNQALRWIFVSAEIDHETCSLMKKFSSQMELVHASVSETVAQSPNVR